MAASMPRQPVIGALGVFGTTVGDLDGTDTQMVQARTRTPRSAAPPAAPGAAPG